MDADHDGHGYSVTDGTECVEEFHHLESAEHVYQQQPPQQQQQQQQWQPYSGVGLDQMEVEAFSGQLHEHVEEMEDRRESSDCGEVSALCFAVCTLSCGSSSLLLLALHSITRLRLRDK